MIHLKKRGRDPDKFEIMKLAGLTEGHTGSEIEEEVISGMYSAFAKEREVTTEDIIEAVEATVPLSSTMREDIDGLRRWAETRAVSASVKQKEYVKIPSMPTLGSRKLTN